MINLYVSMSPVLSILTISKTRNKTGFAEALIKPILTAKYKLSSSVVQSESGDTNEGSTVLV